MQVLSFVLISFFSLISLAQPNNYTVQILNADWCPYCKELVDMLAAENMSTHFTLEINGREESFTVEILDYDNMSEQEVLAAGFSTDGVPQISVRKGDQFLDSSFNATSSQGLVEIINPLASDTYESYVERLGSFNRRAFEFRKLIQRLTGHKTIEEQSEPMPLVKSTGQVLFWGTGFSALDNPMFSANEIKKSRNSLVTNGVRTEQISVLYGSGDTSNQIPDTIYSVGNVRELVSAKGLNPIASFSIDSFISFFAGASKSESKNLLLVSVGAANRDGLPMWANDKEFSPEQMKLTLDLTEGKKVMVSGSCYAGAFSGAASCGFFAARPDTDVIICNEIPANGFSGYVAKYFESVDDEYADLNYDGKTSFSEAHWFATLNGSRENVTYTDVDRMVDEFYDDKNNIQDLPESITVEDAVAAISAHGTAGALVTFKELTADMERSHPIYLKETPVNVSIRAASGSIVFDPFAVEEEAPVYQLLDVEEAGFTYYFTTPWFTAKKYYEFLSQNSNELFIAPVPTSVSGEWLVAYNTIFSQLSYEKGRFSDLNLSMEQYIPENPKSQLLVAQLVRRAYFRKALSEETSQWTELKTQLRDTDACGRQGILEFIGN